jgi:branched-chain amino acid transport system substrate-binding protein
MAPRAVALAVAVLSLGCASPRGRNADVAPASDRVDPVVHSPAEAPAEGALRVAAIFPTSGRYAVSGMQSLNGARLAVDELNRAGGIDGRHVALREFATGSYFVDAQQAAVLAAGDGALALVGSNSSELSAAVAAEAEEQGVVQVSNVSTAQDLTWDPQTGRNRSFVFRVCSSDVVMGALLADFALQKLGSRRAAVLYEVGRAYSMKLARSFIDRYRDASGRAPAEFFYLALETDFRPQLRLIADYGPDVVFVPGSFSDASLIAAQATALGLRFTLLGGDAWSSPLLFRRGGPPGEAYFAELCSPAPGFDRRYQAVFGEETQGCRAILAHDAVDVVAAGLRALGPLDDEALGAGLAETRRRLRDAVAEVETVGASGPIRFDGHGDRRQGVALSAVEPGPDGRPVALARGWLGER